MGVTQFRSSTTGQFLTPPWSVLGVSVEHARNVDEAVRIAQLDWEVTVNEPVLVVSGREVLPIPRKAATVRQSPVIKPLAVVGDRYRAVQNRDAFDLIEALRRDSDLTFGWAGEYDGGRKVFLTVNDPEQIVVGSDDVHDVLFLALNSHDGSTAVRLEIVLSRRRFSTQPVMRFPKVIRQVRMKHTTNVQERAQMAKDSLPKFREYLAAFLARAEELNRRPFSVQEFARYAEALFTKPGRSQNILDDIVAKARGLFAEEPQTRWGAYCAVVRYLDRFQTAQGNVGTADEQRAIRVLDGNNVGLKEAAAESLART